MISFRAVSARSVLVFPSYFTGRGAGGNRAWIAFKDILLLLGYEPGRSRDPSGTLTVWNFR